MAVLEPLFAAVFNVVRFLLLRVPVLTAAAVAVGFVAARYGTSWALLTVAVPLTVLVLWAVLHRPSFRNVVGPHLYSEWRRWWVYSRQWQPVFLAHGLAVSRGQEVPMVPRLLGRAHCDRWADRLRVDLVPGLGPEHLEKEAPNLAHAFGARACTVKTLRPGRVQLTFATFDPLMTAVPAIPILRRMDLTAVPVGVRDDGEMWTLPAIGTHLLIAGATGAGKGSVLWSLIRGLASDITSGRVQVWGIDPKGGMELGFGRAMFARLVDTTPEQMADLLEEAVRVMDARTSRLAGHSRLHAPSVEEPLIVVVIDELASLTTYMGNRDVRKRVDAALQQLLTKGRAPGVTVVGALQDPRKEVLSYRDLFPARVALRLAEREQVSMVLGDRAWDAGAHCERIPHALPGVGYVYLDGQPEPVRVRAAHVTDDDIRDMANHYPASTSASRPAPAVEPPGSLVTAA